MLIIGAFEDDRTDFDRGRSGPVLPSVMALLSSLAQRQLTRSILPICCSTTPGFHSGWRRTTMRQLSWRLRPSRPTSDSATRTRETVGPVEGELHHPPRLRLRLAVHQPRKASLAVGVTFAEMRFEGLPGQPGLLLVKFAIVGVIPVARGVHQSDEGRRIVGLRTVRTINVRGDSP